MITENLNRSQTIISSGKIFRVHNNAFHLQIKTDNKHSTLYILTLLYLNKWCTLHIKYNYLELKC